MLSQMRRDPILATIAVVKGGILALNAGVMAGLVTNLAAGSESRSTGSMASSLFLAGLMWFSIAPFLLFGKARERCNALDLALPIPARKIWLAHVSALMLVGLVFLALMLGTLWILLWMFRSAPADLSLLKQAPAGIFLPVAAGLALMVILSQRAQTAVCRIPNSRAFTVYSILLLGSGFALVVYLATLPPLAALVPLGLSAWLGCRAYASLPPAFVWMPADAGAGSEFPQDARDEAVRRGAVAEEWAMNTSRGPMRGLQLVWVLIRLLYRNPRRNLITALFFSPLLFLWGFFMSGFLDAWRYMELPQFANIILSGYLLLSFLPVQMMQLPCVDFLPISRKRLAACLFIPGFLVLAAGIGTGAIGASILERSRLQIQLQTSASSFIPPYRAKAPVVRIPPEYCQISWGGDPQDVASPWGESHPVWKYRLYPGSRITVYSPFSTPEGSSPQYVAFQISRAIEAIYGVSIPYREILDRYLDVSADHAVILKDPGRLLADHPEWRPRAVIALTPFLLAMIGIVYMIMVSIYLRAWRAGISDARKMAVSLAMAVAAIAVSVAQVGVMVVQWVRPDVAAAFIKILMFKLVQTMPGGALTAWAPYALVLWGMYEVCRRQFQRIEVLPFRSGRSSR